MLHIPCNRQEFMSGKYKHKEHNFHKDSILKAGYEGITVGGYYKGNKNNIMSHNQFIEEFYILGGLYQTDNMEGWEISNKPTLLQEIAENYPVNVECATNTYMQQVEFYAQLNVSKCKAQHPDILEPSSSKKK